MRGQGFLVLSSCASTHLMLPDGFSGDQECVSGRLLAGGAHHRVIMMPARFRSFLRKLAANRTWLRVFQ